MSTELEEQAIGRGKPVAPGYRVVDHIARGRLFDVYDVWSEERLCRCVAKALRPDRLDDAWARRQLETEGRLLRRLTHPHLVRAYEIVREPRPVTILETLTGATVASLVDDGVELSAPEVAMLGLHLCSAVSYLHLHGYLHLDLKPSNIVAEAGRAKVIDLSVARRPGRVPPGTGTWCYLSPEQATGGAVGPAADVWGIGVVLFEAATGLPALDEDEDAPTGVAEPKLARLAGAPAALQSAIAASLALDPDRRATVDELWARLERVDGVPSPTAPRDS